MSAPEWAHKVRPTLQEVQAARSRSRAEGMVAALMRAATATIWTLAEEGIVCEVTQGSLTDGQYLEALWPFALAVTDREAPGTRANLAAEMLGLISTLFTSMQQPGEPDHVKHYELLLAIGYRAGMLTLDEAGLFDVAGKALKAQEGRSQKIRERNRSKTAAWHPAAIAKATRHRETFPHRATAQIADLIHSDPTIPSPSYDQVLTTLRAWEKSGTIPKRKKAQPN